MKFPMTLRTRVALLILTAIFPLFGLALLGEVLTSRAAVDQTGKDLEFSASLIAANQERLADSVRQVLTTVSSMPEILEGKEPECQRYFKALTTELPMYTNIGIVGADGMIRCHSVPNNPRVFAGDRPWFQSALASGNFGASGFLLGHISGNPMISFALPVKDGNGKIKSMAFAAMLLSEVAKNIASVPLPAGQGVVIMDRDGVVLAASPDTIATVGKPMLEGSITDAIKAGQPRIFNATAASGAEQIYAFRPSRPAPEAPFFILVSASRSKVLAPASLRLSRVISALVLIALFGMWLAWRLVGRAIVKPATDILEATRRIQAGALDTRLQIQPGAAQNEMTRIASGFNSMAESIQRREEEQKTSFAELSRIQNQLLAAQKLGRMGYWELDMASNRLAWSPEIHQFFGLQLGEFDGKFASFLKMIHPDDLARFSKLRDDAILDGTALEAEYRIITPTGQVRWMHHVGRALASEAGQTVTRSGMVQDITVQQASRQHLRLLETAVARLNDVIVIAEAGTTRQPDLRIVFVNDAFEKQTGYSRQEALGRSPAMLKGPNTPRPELDRIDQALHALQPVQVELINYTKTGTEYWVEIDIVPIIDNDERCSHWVFVQRDVTQRKQAETALIASEQRYAALFENAPVPMWVFATEDHRFLTVNRAAVENYGYSADEFRSMTVFDIRDEQDHAALRKHFYESPDPRKAWQHRRKDGSYLMARGAAKVIQYAGRDARFAVSMDVTAQFNTEKEIGNQIFKLQHAAEAAQAITWHQTVDGMLQETADQARGVIGAHQCVVSLTPDHDALPVLSKLAVSEKFATYEAPIELADGYRIYAMVHKNNRVVRLTQAELQAHPRWQEFRDYTASYPTLRGWLAVPLTGRDGQNIGLLQLSDKYEGDFTLQDEYVAIELAQLASVAIENARLLEQVHQLNTGLEQKVAERTLALARQEALFRALAKQAPQVIWTADSTGATTYFNQAWFDLMGGTLKNWTGLKWTSVVHPEDLAGLHANWTHAVATRLPFMGIRRLRAKDGRYHVMSYRGSPVLDENGDVSFWVGVDADITDLKNIESALRVSNQELEAFSYSVSHDLRAPLNTVDGFSRLLAKQIAGDASTKAQHYLTRIQSGVAQMGQLIEDLLSLAQLSRAQLNYEGVDLSELSRTILGEWQVRAPDRKVAFHVQPDVVASGDARLLRVLMENLLGNAWKFTSELAEANITVGQQLDANGSQVFFVRDDGVGFDMAYADKLFVVFQRLHPVSEFPGSGVGLATVSRVISRHGGKIWAESTPGKGATFFFSLPGVPVAQ